MFKDRNLFGSLMNARFFADGDGGGDGGIVDGGVDGGAGGGGGGGTPETFVNPDGSFKDGWYKQHVEEAHQKDTTWLGAKSIKDLTNRISHLNGKLTTAGKGVFPISEKSTPLQVQEFRQAFGIPEKPDGYTFQVPQEVEKFYDPNVTAAFQSIAHKQNFTPQQYTAVMAFYADMMKQSETAVNTNPLEFYHEILPQVQEIQAKESEAQLRTKWGDQYDSRLHLANLAITENTKEGEERTALLERVGNDPLVADFLATIQNKHYSESNGVDTSLGGGYAKMSVDQQVDTLLKDPNYLDGRTNPKEHMRLVNEVNRLLSQKSGGKMLG